MSSRNLANHRCFTRETEMASPVVAWMRDHGLNVKREFALPWGICDIVALQFDPAQVSARLSYGQTQPVGPLLRLSILFKIPDVETGGSVNLGELQSEHFPYLTVEVLSTQLDCLARKKFVKRSSSGELQKLNGWSPLHRRIVAVELKLSKISEAIA